MSTTPTNFYGAAFLASLLFLSQVKSIEAAELQFTPTDSSVSYNCTLTLDQIDKLAGLKLSISYPIDQLHFESVAKGQPFDSFLHVVNDKNPGKIIVVMASANGVSGTNLPLLQFNFTKLQSDIKLDNYTLKTIHCQLMDDTLQEISCNTHEDAKNIVHS